jgi:hypothetical protein
VLGTSAALAQLRLAAAPEFEARLAPEPPRVDSLAWLRLIMATKPPPGGSVSLALEHGLLAAHRLGVPVQYRVGASSQLSAAEWRPYARQPQVNVSVVGVQPGIGCDRGMGRLHLFFQVRYVPTASAQPPAIPDGTTNTMLTGSQGGHAPLPGAVSNVVDDSICVPLLR